MSSLLEQASLIVTPNAFKAGKLYSIKPTDGSGDLDVVRATTATRVNSAGLIESVANNIPRLDYTNGSCPSILVEPQRTNLFLQSNVFDNASWVKLNSSATLTSIESPILGENAYLYSITNLSNFINQARSIASSPNTISIFVKKNIGSLIQLNLGSNFAIFNLDTQVFSNVTNCVPSFESFLDGWFKISIFANVTTNLSAFINIPNTASISDSVYISCAQLEAGSNATSYIPTVATAVTRNADVISKTGITDLIGQSEGTLFVEVKIFPNNSSVICLHENTLNNNRILINLNSITNQIIFYIENETVIQVNSSFSTPLLSSSFFKVAFAYKENDCSFFINGVKVGTDILSQTFSGTTISRLSFSNSTGTGNFQGKVKSVQVYPTALSDAELQQLTTL